MGMYVSDGNISIGYEMFTDIRKKPCICVKQGNKCHVLGTFSNKDNAEFFVDKLAELTSVKDSDEEHEECKDCSRWNCLDCPYADI